MQKVDIPLRFLEREESSPGHKNYGQDSSISYSEDLQEWLWNRYARRGLCLKAFRHLAQDEREDPLRRFHWGGARLDRTMLVQNLFAAYGLAPRVYDVLLLQDGRLVQVVQYATGEGKPQIKAAQDLVRRYRLGVRLGDDYSEDPTDAACRYVAMDFKWVGGLFVDFGRFYVRYPKAYRDDLARALAHRKDRATGELFSYQAIPELKVRGQRDQAHRLKHMRLDEIDFRGKTVLDIGCNTGAFLREALKRGAKRAVGIDDRRCRIWTRTMDLLGYHNCDIYQLSLPDERHLIPVLSGLETFDIVFCLGIVQHIEGGLQKWVADLTGEVLFLEGDVKVGRAKYDADLSRWFRWHELTGYIRDEDRRCLFRAYKTELPRSEQASGTAREMAIQRGLHPVGRRMLTEAELGCLYDYALAAPAGASAEVGVAHGSSLICWAAARAGISGWIWAVDIEDSTELRGNLRRAELIHKVRVLIQDSVEAAKGIGDGSLAFCFIDADHSEKGIQRDLEAWSPKVRTDGYLAVHDYDPDEEKRGKGYAVYRVVKEWAGNHGWKLVSQVGLVAIFQLLKWGVPDDEIVANGAGETGDSAGTDQADPEWEGDLRLLEPGSGDDLDDDLPEARPLPEDLASSA